MYFNINCLKRELDGGGFHALVVFAIFFVAVSAVIVFMVKRTASSKFKPNN